MQRIMTLITDFGTQDHYVAAVKGVLLSINPALTLVDITHEVAPQNIQGGGFVLASVFRHFPRETLHLAVVDPGVGGKRRGLAAATGHHIFVGPDNGLFDRVFALDPPELIVSLENPAYQLPEPSPTFHGRDVFAPTAAHLSLGLPLEELGPAIPHRRRATSRVPLTHQEEHRGEVIHVDRFGNLISNIEIPSGGCVPNLSDLQVYLGTRPVLTGPNTFETAPPSTPFAFVGSSGHLEIAVRNGSAHEITGLGVGGRILIRRQK